MDCRFIRSCILLAYSRRLIWLALLMWLWRIFALPAATALQYATVVIFILEERPPDEFHQKESRQELFEGI